MTDHTKRREALEALLAHKCSEDNYHAGMRVCDKCDIIADYAREYLKILIATSKALEARPCAHAQWFIHKGAKHVIHEGDCASEKTCHDPCSRCAALSTVPEVKG